MEMTKTNTKTLTTKTQDATALLKADHKLVASLFADYEITNSNNKKKQLVEQICKELSIHAQVEEEIFYPAARDLLGDDADLVDEADVEHASAKELISQIESGNPDDMHFNARVKVLGEYIDHHVQEEQDELFPKVKAASLVTLLCPLESE